MRYVLFFVTRRARGGKVVLLASRESRRSDFDRAAPRRRDGLRDACHLSGIGTPAHGGVGGARAAYLAKVEGCLLIDKDDPFRAVPPSAFGGKNKQDKRSEEETALCALV